MNIEFKVSKWKYKLKCSENIIGIKDRSGKGKTKLIKDLYLASVAGLVKQEVVAIYDEMFFHRVKNTITDGDAICIDNLELYSKDSLNELSKLIHQYNHNIWILVGHSDWIDSCTVVKKLNIDNKVVTLISAE